MSDPFIGEIKMFGGNFAPRGWAYCDGQLLPISQYTALFSLLGTMYGGDGVTTFALPDLRGRVSVHPGSGPGLTPRSIGEKGGFEQENHSVLPIGAAYYDADNSRKAAANVGSNMQPFLCVNYIIALQGIYPSRN